MTHAHHLTNIDLADVPRYRQAIERSGADLVIQDGRYDAYGRRWSDDGASLWCDLLEGDLSAFWAAVEAQP
jgi:hypothetical protein